KGPAPALVVYGSRGMGKTALARAFSRGVRRPIPCGDVVADNPGALPRDLAAAMRPLGGSGAPDAIEGDVAGLKPLRGLEGGGGAPRREVDWLTRAGGLSVARVLGGNAARLREVCLFSPAESGLLLCSRAGARVFAGLALRMRGPVEVPGADSRSPFALVRRS